MNSLLIHLSDLHIQEKPSDDWSLERARLIARSAARGAPHDIVLLIISGDVAFSGTTDQYEIAEKFLGALVQEIAPLVQCEVRLIVAPGNHDCDFSVSGRLRSFAKTQRDVATISDPEMIEKLTEPMVNFRAFEAKIENQAAVSRTPLHKAFLVQTSNLPIQVRVFNSPVYSDLHEKKGELYLPENIFDVGWEKDALRIAVMHHAPPWFTEPQARQIRTLLRKNAHLILYGHEHIPEVGQITTYPAGRPSEAIEFDGPVLHEHGGGESKFVTIEVRTATPAGLTSYEHTWNGANGFEAACLTSLDLNDGWISIPKKSHAFEVSAKFRERIEDPGMTIVSRDGRRLTLKDVYVPCDLAESVSSSKRAEEVFSADVLNDISELQGGAIIQGDEKHGKTTLLFTLFDRYHSAGYVPIYVSLKEHKVKTAKDFSKILAGAVEAIYPHESEDSFAAVPKNRRVLLVDDFDAITKAKLRSEVLAILQARCDFFLLTSTIRPQLADVLGEDGNQASAYRSLRFDKFSYKRRSQLIGRWVTQVEQVEDREEYLRRVDVLEKAASSALGHNLVPRIPQMLLIFLHSASASSSTKLESGALANYYTFLVTRQLLDTGVPADELEEHISFARIISFFMHSKEQSYVTVDDLEVCNATFAEEFHPGPMQGRLNVLRNAKLLVEYGDGAFQWKHSYLHHLFLGGFLGANIDAPQVRDAIKTICTHLYVRSNANALLFLVHFNKDRKVFGYLQQVIEGVFKDAQPLQLGVDTKEFAKIIKNANELMVPSDVLKEREKRQEVRDQTEAEGDGLKDKPEKGTPSKLEDLIVLFKASEILGQLLKEQYASITRALREPIVVALLNAHMRAAGGIIKELALKQSMLQSMIAKEIQNEKDLSEEKRTEIAQSVVSNVVQMFMFAFFQKLAECLSSDKTLDLIRHVKWSGTLEERVFLLACELNLQRPLPLARLDELLKVSDDDPAFVALIRNLVQVRIRLFHTKAPELQALAKKFMLDINRLNALTFRENKTR